MSFALAIFALAISCVPAAAWLNRLIPAGVAARTSLIAGYSCLLGLLGTTLVMRLFSWLTLEWSLTAMGLVGLGVLGVALLLPAKTSEPNTLSPVHQSLQLSRMQQCFVALCLLLLATRLLALGLELTSRPVWAWDAKQHWTKQAKVFFELRSTVPFVSLEQWLAVNGEGVYTNMHPDYPIATPLLQAWIAVALGYWDNSLVNTPWLLMWLGIGFVFYAQARIAGAALPLALAATFMVLSMPYLNIQVALAGYADLLLALGYLASFAAFYAWTQTQARWQLLLALASGAGCLLIKNEGFYWFLSFAPGCLLTVIGVRKGLAWLAVAGGALLLVLTFMPPDLTIAGHSLASMDIQYRPESWYSIYLSAFIHDNWHFLVYLLTVALLVVPLKARHLIPVAAVIVSALCLYLALYLLTSNAYGATRFTSLNRVALQLAPAIGFFVLTVFLAVTEGRPRSESTRHL